MDHEQMLLFSLHFLRSAFMLIHNEVSSSYFLYMVKIVQ